MTRKERRSVVTRHWLATLVIALSAAACGSPSPAEKTPIERAAFEDWKIEPRLRVGALNRFGSELDLARAYGARNLRDSSVTLGEGETAPGTLLYPDDPQRRVEIIWSDPGAKRAPRRAVLRGDRSRWVLPRQISLGASLADLESANGRPFRLAGFAWDYAGAVTSWEGGALDSLLPGVRLYLEPRIEDRAGAPYRHVQGDREFSSNNRDMRALKPRIYQIFVDFDAEGSPRAPGDAGGHAPGGR
jgi:hypothetical protein